MPHGLSITGAVEVRDVDRTYRVEIDTLDLQRGEALALSGASGSGKTLVLEVLGLLRPPARGTIYRAMGQDLAALWGEGARSTAMAHARAGLFGFVPQSGGLLPFLDVAANVTLPQRICGREDAGWAATLLDHLGLTSLAASLPDALSIGQRQRAAVARALAHRPAFVIADEPTAALDPDSADTVLALLLEMVRETGAGLILSSHDSARIDAHAIPRHRLQPVPGAAHVSRLQAVPC